MTDEQPEALRLADELLDGMSDEHWNQLNADAAAELRRLHAENSQWRSVFGHLGTPDEIGNEWIALQDKQAKDEALLKQALKALEYAYDHMPLLVAHNIEATMEAIKERLNG